MWLDVALIWLDVMLSKPNRVQSMSDVPSAVEESNPASASASRSAVSVLAWAGATAMLLGVFSLYVRPDFMVMLADMVWACF